MHSRNEFRSSVYDTIEMRTIKILWSRNVYFVSHFRHTADPGGGAVEGVGFAAVCFL
jgi:hypothetical protein